MKPILSCAILFALLSVFPSAAQTIYYVNHAATGANNGTSWTNAFKQLQDAIDAAAPGSLIWVAKGVYKPTQKFNSDTSDRYKTFYIGKKIKLYGGFDGTETALYQRDYSTNLTVLSGDLDDNDLDLDVNGVAESVDQVSGANAYHVLWIENADTTARLDGFTISAGCADGSILDESAHAGAIYNNGYGAAAQASPSIANCTFSGNFAGFFAAAIYNVAFFGGEASPVLTNCVFANNFGDFEGGALYNEGTFDGKSNPAFIDCAFVNNEAGFGGAMVNDRFAGTSECNPMYTNCLFFNNKASFGGAVNNQGASAFFVNCTFSKNSAPFGGVLRNGAGPGVTVFSNCILWANVGSQENNLDVADSMAVLQISHSLMDETACPPDVDCGSGMVFNQNPLFVNGTAGNLRLQTGSPAINTGSNAAVPDGTATDLDGNIRIWNGTVDMGAYEYDAPPPAAGVPTASFSANMNSGCAPFTVQFINQSTGNPIAFNWQFPGGMPSSSTAENPVVVYTDPGKHSVVLTVYNPFGEHQEIKPEYITVIGIPVAAFGVIGSDGQTVTLVNLSQNADAYEWHFGDGNSSASDADTVVHTYAVPGDYTIQLVAQNSCGASVQETVETQEPGPTSLMRLYPNPNQGVFSLEINKEVSGRIELSVTSSDGRLLRQEMMDVEAGAGSRRIDLSDVSPGLYLLRLRSGKKTTFARVLIQR